MGNTSPRLDALFLRLSASCPFQSDQDHTSVSLCPAADTAMEKRGEEFRGRIEGKAAQWQQRGRKGTL